MDNQYINPMHIPCKNCVFAIYENNSQTECAMGMLEKFNKLDHIDVLEVYDEEKEFYVINNSKCTAYRENKYFKARDMENATIEEKIEYVKNKMKIKYLAVIDCRARTPDDLAEVLAKLSVASVKPAMIMVLTYQDSEHSFSDYYIKLNKSKIGCQWKIKGLIDGRQDLITSIHQSINIGAESCNFVLGVGNDYSKIQEIIEKANTMVYEEVKSFAMITNESKETYLFNQFVYKSALAHDHDIITNTEEHIIV